MQKTNRRRRWLRGLLFLTLVLLVSAVAAGWVVLRRTVLPLEGQLRLPGLGAPVEFLFDAQAVPHIYSRDSDDAWTAVGFLHGRERLWQMEVYRRATGGRLSEMFGPATVRADKRFIAMGLRRAAAAEWQTATPEVRRAIEHYAAGVNAAIAAMGRWQRPPEFLMLGLTPEPWTPVDTLSIARLLAWRLAENRRGELVRGRLTRAIGAAEANLLLGGLPADAPAILDAAGRPSAAPVKRAADLPIERDTVARAGTLPLPPGLEWLDMTSRPGGSNSWALSGTRTATGRPLLANDPHLQVEMPAIWYEAHVVTAGLDVAGVTLPGAPFVIIGHNDRLAWGLTNTGADVVDFYVEDVDMSTRTYLFRGQRLPLTVTSTQIGVRGQSKPEAFDVFSTRHGPLVATEAIWEDPPDLAKQSGRITPRPLAMRWEAIAQGETAGAFLAIDRAANWDQFLEGVRRFGSPSQNFIYADVDGHIGYAMSGRIPLRGSSDGGTPVPGWTGEYEWTGSVEPQALPAMLDPPSGQIVTANNEVDRHWPKTMTRDWASPFRSMRIAQMLGTRTGLTQADMRAMQLDVQSAEADRVLAAVEAAHDSVAFVKAEPEAQHCIERLRLWDRKVDDRPVAALYEAFLRALWRRTFADEMDADVFKEFFEYGIAERYAGIDQIIDNPSSHWWNDIATVDKVETRDDIVLLAAADAPIALRAQFGAESNWAWDRVHSLSFRHALGAGGAVLNWAFSRGPFPQTGDAWTVRKASVDVRQPFGVGDISSYRQVIDIGNWDAAWAVNPTGQSGNMMSPHYFDQNELWRTGGYRNFAFSRAAVEKARASRMLLTP
jgi:penicillin G amidase